MQQRRTAWPYRAPDDAGRASGGVGAQGRVCVFGCSGTRGTRVAPRASHQCREDFHTLQRGVVASLASASNSLCVYTVLGMTNCCSIVVL